MGQTIARSTLTVALGVVLVSQGIRAAETGEQPATPANPPPAEAATAPPAAVVPAPTLSDAQIAAVLLAANQGEVDVSKLATKSKNSEVNKFAQQMVADHSAAHKETASLATKLKMKPEKSDMSASLEAKSKKTVGSLKKLKGADFDKAYIDDAVTAHQETLDTIDKSLMPSVKNDELKSLIGKMRPTVAAHLENVKKIQASLGAPATN